ncbi:MAG: AraC family transcriptional regulator, partial [Oscillospiraceae bacterium]|nr:AraC family transcriptional regulator [Oscillospiraceae bacterium]
IADILGYDDYKYMGRIFKSTYGVAPSEFRNDPDI